MADPGRSRGPACITRRAVLKRAAAGGGLLALGTWARPGRAAPVTPRIEAGMGVVDTSPPPGIELAGFHRAPGKERRVTGIRHPTAARALVLRHGETAAAIVSLDVLAVSREFARQTALRVARQVGIPAGHVRLCATHTHSMPSFRYLRQWGAMPAEYMAEVQEKIVRAVAAARDDLAPAEVLLGRHRVAGGNFNRTTSTWKTDAQFGPDSTDEERWLDTMLTALLFERAGGKGDFVWYHFSAHPVCYTDGNAGPDWPALVDEKVRNDHKLTPSFLQGHCGDVNPGDGDPWLGEPDQVAGAVCAGIDAALDAARPIEGGGLWCESAEVELPLDVALFRQRLDAYRADPSKCNRGSYVDERFAADWAESAARWDPERTTLAAPISALRLGRLGLLFHPAELYSFYGLAIGRDSPLDPTLAVGYTDAMVGYLPDPNAYKREEYAALTVPGILDLPPFTPLAARHFAAKTLELLRRVAKA